MEPRQRRVWQMESAAPELKASQEYASLIIEARQTGVSFCFNGNVMNHGSITNLAVPVLRRSALRGRPGGRSPLLRRGIAAAVRRAEYEQHRGAGVGGARLP